MNSLDTGILSNTTRDVIAIVALLLTAFQTILALTTSGYETLRKQSLNIPNPSKPIQEDRCWRCGAQIRLRLSHCSKCGFNLRSFSDNLRELIKSETLIWFAISESLHFICNIVMSSRLTSSSIEILNGSAAVLTCLFTFADALTFMAFFSAADGILGDRYSIEETPEQEARFAQSTFRSALIFSVLGLATVLVSLPLSSGLGWLPKALFFQLLGPGFVITFFAAMYNLMSFLMLCEKGWHRLRSWLKS